MGVMSHRSEENNRHLHIEDMAGGSKNKVEPSITLFDLASNIETTFTMFSKVKLPWLMVAF